jgi:aromatic-L-amino-acid decarboxylase
MMSPEEFRRHAHGLVDRIADQLRDVEQRRVVPSVLPGEIRRQLPPSPPAHGEPFDALLDEFTRVIEPGMTWWNHPGWFAYFPANHSPPSILAEFVTAAMGAQCMSWQTSPAATELEQQAMEWLRQLVGLPAAFTGVIQDTASTSTLVALLCARERATGWRIADEGLAAATQPLVVYASEERHSSVDKAVKLAGYGLRQLRLVPTDDAFAMRPEALAAMIAEDRAAGRIPAAIVATLGTTSSTAVDPLEAIGVIAEREGAWLHVDASYGGAAAVAPEFRGMFAGVERADSLVFNPHKWLFVNFDCSAYYVRDRAALLRTCALTPEYLRTAHDDEVVNYRDWGIQLGRRFRALKLWWVMRSLGEDGLRALIRQHVADAQWFARQVASDARLELLAPVPLALVCFACRPRTGESAEETDARTRALLARLDADPRVHLTHTTLRGRYVIRLSVGQWMTQRAHVAQAWSLVQQGLDAAD